MLPIDRPEFAELMADLGRAYDRAVPQATLDDYWNLLRDLPLHAVREAAQRHKLASTYWPKIAELRAVALAVMPRRSTATPWGEDDPWKAMLKKTALSIVTSALATGGLTDEQMDRLADDIGVKAASLRSSYGPDPERAPEDELHEIRDNIGVVWARQLGVRWTPKRQPA